MECVASLCNVKVVLKNCLDRLHNISTVYLNIFGNQNNLDSSELKPFSEMFSIFSFMD